MGELMPLRGVLRAVVDDRRAGRRLLRQHERAGVGDPQDDGDARLHAGSTRHGDHAAGRQHGGEGAGVTGEALCRVDHVGPGVALDDVAGDGRRVPLGGELAGNAGGAAGGRAAVDHGDRERALGL